MPPRIVKRNFRNLFLRSDTDLLPGPKVSADIALTAIVEDLSHLVPPILNASGVFNATSPPVPARMSVVLVTANAGFSFNVWLLENRSLTPGAGTFLVNVLDADPALANRVVLTGGMFWGPDRVFLMETGDAPAHFGGLAIPDGLEWRAPLKSPIVCLPGQFLVMANFVVNQAIIPQLTWEERVA